jgi:hypothetical protein
MAVANPPPSARETRFADPVLTWPLRSTALRALPLLSILMSSRTCGVVDLSVVGFVNADGFQVLVLRSVLRER